VKRGSVRLPFGVALGCLLGLAGAARAQEAPRPLRIVTYNILHGGLTSDLLGDGEQLDQRLAMTITALRDLRPDVIGVQEASRGRWRGDVTARLAAALDLEHVYAPATFSHRIVRAVLGLDEGPGILSRFPIAGWEALPIDGCGRYRRTLVCATLTTPWGPLEACSTHVDGGACQAERLQALVERRSGAHPVVLVGDLNATEQSPGIARLIGAGFVDTFRAINPTLPGFTVWQWIHAPWRMARRRVDFVLAAPGAGGSVRVHESRVVLDQPGRAANGATLWPSDHYGVYTEVELFGDRR
jgi:endonuclease/exonuclease/phosphatase family metal-dependent hydrolase